MMGKLIILGIFILFISCSEKSVREQSTISLKNFDEFSEELSNFQKSQNQRIKEYNESIASKQQFIVLNYPFESNENYDILVYWNDKLVYQKSNGKLIEFQPKNNFTHIRVCIINDSRVYHFNTKGGFDVDSNVRYYYLVFCPTNDKDYMFNIIPSNSTVE